MRRDRGLLALLSALLAISCALGQIPFINGLALLQHSSPTQLGQQPHPLALYLRPAKALGLARGSGGAPLTTLATLRDDHRPDTEIARLAHDHRLPADGLKALLAISSKGTATVRGMFWPQLPAAQSDVANEGLARTRAAAKLLGRYRAATSSPAGAWLAWSVGLFRAQRLCQQAGAEFRRIVGALRLHLLAYHRHHANQQLCSIQGLALALHAGWPVASADSTVAGAGLRLTATTGEAVRATMPGRVSFRGNNGSQGLCVEIVHACQMRSETCGLNKARLQLGARVQAGAQLGTAGPALWFGLRLGSQALDPRILMPSSALGR